MNRRSGFWESWQLRAKFAAALSRLYGAEVPAYNTLVEVSTEVNRDVVTDDRLGSLDRVTAERHGAIRVGSARELADVADLFSAFGMYPVGFYDLRDAASPVPVVSTAFRPIDTDQLAHNPFRVFTSMLATSDARFFSSDLRARVERFVGARQLFDPALIAEARRIAADGGADSERAERFMAAAVSTFALSREPIDRGWHEELAKVSVDGKYVTQTFLNGSGPSNPSGLAFSADPEQRFIYVAQNETDHLVVVERKTLEVLYQFGKKSAIPGSRTRLPSLRRANFRGSTISLWIQKAISTLQTLTPATGFSGGCSRDTGRPPQP